MRGVDLHPEDLLEREARGELSPAEQERLKAHLDVCSVCRFELRTRQDVRSEVDQAEEVDVQRLLSAVLTPELLLAPAPVKVAKPLGRRRGRVPRALLLAAALVTIASVAGAAGWTELRAKRTHHGSLLETQVDAPRTSAVATPARAPVGASPLPRAPASAPAAETPDVAPVDVLAPAPSPVPVATAVRAPLAVATSVSEAPIAAISALESAPGALFERANAARHAGDRAGAIESYRALGARFPSSPEAHEALAALGKMLLDGGDNGGALRCFDDYLRAGGPLRQDVMADRALALQRLGRPADEAAAWAALLAAYPASVHGAHARRRLSELERP